VTGGPPRPAGAGMYLHWEGRKGYRTPMPAPRMLEPVPKLSCGAALGNRVIEGDNLQVMVSLRSQYQGAIDVAYLDPPYSTGKKDFAYSDARFHDPNADADDMVYVNNEDGGRHTKWLNYLGRPRHRHRHDLAIHRADRPALRPPRARRHLRSIHRTTLHPAARRAHQRRVPHRAARGRARRKRVEHNGTADAERGHQKAGPPPWLRQIGRGRAILVYRDMPPAVVRAPGWFEDHRFAHHVRLRAERGHEAPTTR
jgi:hypothetical protein